LWGLVENSKKSCFFSVSSQDQDSERPIMPWALERKRSESTIAIFSFKFDAMTQAIRNNRSSTGKERGRFPKFKKVN
jgi:hypothetical protein